MPRIASVMLLAALAAPSTAVAADPVLEWIGVMNDVVMAAGTGPLPTGRNVGLVSASVFDAVNGIEVRYTPLRVGRYRGPHASARAAAAQAAYAMLLHLYPLQISTLDSHLAASLAAISSGPDADRAREIANGRVYGQFVADTIFLKRSDDGFAPNPAPPFVGVDAVGFWRPTTPGVSAAGPQVATMTPWVLIRASQFRLPPPPALTSELYALDFNETKAWGGATGSLRNDDQTALALFWNGNTALFWNRIAVQVAERRQMSLVETARLFGALNVAMADSAVACWDSKFRFVLWRPVTAIQQAAADGNDQTAADATWSPLLVTPPHPEYPSGHSTVSGAAAHVLESFFGDDVAFTVESPDVPGSVPRSFASFSSALAEIHNARVFGGIHFRTACQLGSKLGVDVANWVLSHAMTPRGERQ